MPLSLLKTKVPHLSLFGVAWESRELSDHRNTLRGAVQSSHHVGPLDASQRGAQQPQSGAVLQSPVREEGVSGGLATPKQVQLFGLVAQRRAQLPPAPALSLLQEPFHLLLPVGGQVDVQTIVLLAVPLSTCVKT